MVNNNQFLNYLSSSGRDIKSIEDLVQDKYRTLIEEGDYDSFDKLRETIRATGINVNEELVQSSYESCLDHIADTVEIFDKYERFISLREITGILPNEGRIKAKYVELLSRGIKDTYDKHYLSLSNWISVIGIKPDEELVRKIYSELPTNERFDFVLLSLVKTTGIKPLDVDIQRFYRKFLLEGSIVMMSDLLNNCSRLFDIQPKKEILQECYKRLLSEGFTEKDRFGHLRGKYDLRPHDCIKNLKGIVELTGVIPNEEFVQEAYKILVEDGLDSNINYWNFIRLFEATHYTPKVSKEFVIKRNSDYMEKRDFDGEPHQWTDHDNLHSFRDHIGHWVDELTVLTALTAVSLSDEQIEKVYRTLILEGRLYPFNGFKDYTGKSPSHSLVQEGYRLYFDKLRTEPDVAKEKITNLYKFTGVKPDEIPADCVCASYNYFIERDSFSQCKDLEELTSIHLPDSFYEKLLASI